MPRENVEESLLDVKIQPNTMYLRMLFGRVDSNLAKITFKRLKNPHFIQPTNFQDIFRANVF